MFNWIRRFENTIVSMVLFLVGASFSSRMLIAKNLKPTLLVKDPGAVLIQGWTVLILSVLSFLWIPYAQFKEWRRRRHLKRLAARKAAAGHD